MTTLTPNALVHSRYIVYVDESGDHGPVSPDYPMFVLAFCLFDKKAYANTVTSYMHRLKFKYFGHDTVVMHEREIRKALPPFAVLVNAQRRAEFMNDLTTMIDVAPFTLIAAAIHKGKLGERTRRRRRNVSALTSGQNRGLGAQMLPVTLANSAAPKRNAPVFTEAQRRPSIPSPDTHSAYCHRQRQALAALVTSCASAKGLAQTAWSHARPSASSTRPRREHCQQQNDDHAHNGTPLAPPAWRE